MVKTISRDELMKMIGQKREFKLVDVLSGDSYRNQHIKGAISIPLDEIEKDAPKLLNKDETIVTYCASFDCQASTKAAEKLMSMGYKDVLDYKGGLKDYKEANLPLEGALCEKKPSAGCSCC